MNCLNIDEDVVERLSTFKIDKPDVMHEVSQEYKGRGPGHNLPNSSRSMKKGRASGTSWVALAWSWCRFIMLDVLYFVK